MTKEYLEILEEIKTLRGFNQVELNNDENINKSLDIIEQTIKDNDRLLHIIKTKLFSIVYFVDEIRAAIHNINYEDYKYWYTTRRCVYGKDEEMYTKEEFNLIMEYLK